MDNNFFNTLRIGFGVGRAVARHKLDQVHQATRPLRNMNSTMNAVATVSGVATQAIDTVSTGSYQGPGAPLDYANRSSVGRAEAITPEQFRSRLEDSGFDLEANGGVSSLLDRMDPAYLKRIGHKSLLQLANDLEPEQVNSIAGHLSEHLAANPGDETARRIAQQGLKDVAFPTSIEQGHKENCGGVMLQQIWAHEQPESYVEGLTSLSQGEPYEFENGRSIAPLNDALSDGSDERAESVKVMSDALSRYAHQRTPWRPTAVMAKNSALGGLGNINVPGLDMYHPTDQQYGTHFPNEILPALEDITGDRYRISTEKDWGRINAARNDGDFVPTLISGSNGSAMHWVSMVPGNGNGNTGDVNISSWGAEYSSPQSTTDRHVRVVLLRE